MVKDGQNLMKHIILDLVMGYMIVEISIQKYCY